MIEHSEIFQVLAEMAIAVAGFAGVAAAIDQRAIASTRMASYYRVFLLNIFNSMDILSSVSKPQLAGTPNKSGQQERFAPGPLYSGPCLKRYASR